MNILYPEHWNISKGFHYLRKKRPLSLSLFIFSQSMQRGTKERLQDVRVCRTSAERGCSGRRRHLADSWETKGSVSRKLTEIPFGEECSHIHLSMDYFLLNIFIGYIFFSLQGNNKQTKTITADSYPQCHRSLLYEIKQNVYKMLC